MYENGLKLFLFKMGNVLICNKIKIVISFFNILK